MISRPVNGLAPTLLGLLGLKVNGQLPEFFGDTVAPVIDLEGYYLRGRAQYATAQLTVPAGNTGLFSATVQGVWPVVPPGNNRYILSVSASALVPSPGQVRFNCYVNQRTQSNPAHLYGDSSELPSGAVNQYVAAPAIRDVWGGANADVGVLMQLNTAAGVITVDLYVVFADVVI